MDFDEIERELRALIHGALLEENRWVDFLERARELVPNGKATLFFHDADQQQGAFSISAGLSEEDQRDYSLYYASRNPWMEGASKRPVGLIVPDEYMLPKADLLRSEFYNDFLRRQEIRSALGVTLSRDDRCNFLFSITSADPSAQDLTQELRVLQNLIPDLQRAFSFYRREAARPVQIPYSPGSENPLGMLSVNSRRRIAYVNGAAERILAEDNILWADARGRLCACDNRVIDHVDLCLANWHRQDFDARPRSFLLAGSDSAPSRITVIVVTADSERRFFRGPECVLLIERPTAGCGDLAEVQRFYGMTNSEMKIARALATGLTILEIAAEAKLSAGTVRTHLKRLFAKTGTHRQAELALLIQRLSTRGY